MIQVPPNPTVMAVLLRFWQDNSPANIVAHLPLQFWNWRYGVKMPELKYDKEKKCLKSI